MVPPIRFEGPFMGLNTTHDPRQLGMAFATEARNVDLADGRIRPRPPFRSIFEKPNYDVVGVYTWGRGLRTQYVVCTRGQNWITQGKQLWWIDELGNETLLWTRSATAVIEDRVVLPQFVFIRDSLFLFWGADRLRFYTLGDTVKVLTQSMKRVTWTYNGEDVQPGSHIADLVVDTSGTGGIEARVKYAITIRRLRFIGGDDFDEESQGVDDARVLDLSDGGVVNFTLFENVPNWWTPEIADFKIRIYRRNLTEGFSFYRLIHERSYAGEIVEWTDNLSEASIVLSSIETGPFLPVRNGFQRLEQSYYGVEWHQGRLWVTAEDEPNRLYYSELDGPGNISADGYLDFSDGDTAPLTSLKSTGGQLAVGSSRSIFVLSGVFAAPTNETVQTGAPPPPSSHQVYKTRSHVGPAFYNGFIDAGGQLMFPHQSGFFAFGGDSSVSVTGRIKDTWRRFVQRAPFQGEIGPAGLRPDLRISYAHDPENGIVYMLKPTGEIDGGIEAALAREDPPILAYHYGLANAETGAGAWTRHDAEELNLGVVNCIGGYGIEQEPGGQSSLGPYYYFPLLVGTLGGAVGLAEWRPDGNGDEEMPDWVYRTGHLKIAEGFDAHVFHVDFWFADVDPSHGFSAPTEFGFRINGLRYKESTKVRDMTHGENAKVRVGATMKRIQLVAQKAAAWTKGWTHDMGIMGFAVDMGLHGQR